MSLSPEVLNGVGELGGQIASNLEGCLSNPVIMAYGGAVAGLLLYYAKNYINNLDPLSRANYHLDAVRGREKLNLIVYSFAGAVIGATMGALIGGLPYLREVFGE